MPYKTRSRSFWRCRFGVAVLAPGSFGIARWLINLIVFKNRIGVYTTNRDLIYVCRGFSFSNSRSQVKQKVRVAYVLYILYIYIYTYENNKKKTT